MVFSRWIDRPNRGSAGHRALVLDANDDSREIFALGLTSAGYDTQAAGLSLPSSGPDADDAPDLVVLGVGYPPDAGLAALRRLRADPRTALVPVIVCTTVPTADLREEVNRLGAGAVLAKPVALYELVDICRSLLTPQVVAGAG